MPFSIISASAETRINTVITNDQRWVSVTALKDPNDATRNAGWVVTWHSNGNTSGSNADNSGWGVYQQRYNADGTRRDGETRVNTFTNNDQQHASVTALNDGGWVVTWMSANQEPQGGSGQGVYQQRYNADGSVRGAETRVNTFTANDQAFPSVTALADGGWVVTWDSWNQDGSANGVYQQRYNADGSVRGGETRVNTTTANNQDVCRVTALPDGGWLVTWTSGGNTSGSNADTSGQGVYQQRYNADGSVRGSETRVNTFTDNDQREAAATALKDGGWVVTWMSNGQDGGSWGVYQQRYNADGSVRGGETRVNTVTDNEQRTPLVTALADGGWVVVWESRNQDGGGWGLYQQRYNAAGQTAGPEMLVNTFTTDDQRYPSVTTLPDGSWVVSWQSNTQDGSGWGVYQRVFSTPSALSAATGEQALGDGAHDVLSVSGTAAIAGDTIDGGGGTDTLQLSAPGSLDINAPARLTSIERILGSSGDDTITVGRDRLLDVLTLDGGQGNDRLVLTSDTSLVGKTITGFETIIGSTGDDFIVVDQAVLDSLRTAGLTLAGGGGSDTLAFQGNVNLVGLSFTGFATLTGSFGDNILTADAAFLAAHSLAGGTGTDTLRLATAGTHVVGDLRARLTGFETLQGSDGADIFQLAAADAGAFRALDGAVGADRLELTTSGGTYDFSGRTLRGFETLQGAAGNETVTLSGDLAGLTSLDGGAGDDTLVLSSYAYLVGKTITGFETVTGSTGDDLIVVDQAVLDSLRAAGGTLAGGGGADTLAFQGSVNLVGQSFTGFATLTGSFGDDILTADAAFLAAHSLAGGTGNDTLRLATAGTYVVGDISARLTGFETLQGSDGADIFQLAAADIGAFRALDGAVGADRLELTTSGGTYDFSGRTLRGFETILGAAGNETVTLSGDLAGLTSLDGGDGNDTLILSGAVNLSAKTITGFETIKGSANNDTITVDAAILATLAGGGATFDGGGGTDTLVVTGDASVVGRAFTNGFRTLTGDGGANALTIDTATLTQFASLEGGAGNDRLVLASGGTYDFTTRGLRGFETLAGSTEDEVITLNSTNLTNLVSLDGGTGNDRLVLSGTVSLLNKTVAGFETLAGSSNNETITLTAAQLAAFASLDGGGGTADTLLFQGDADLTGRTYTGFATLGGDGGANVLTVDAAILAAHSLDGGAGNDRLVLASGGGTYDFTAKGLQAFETLAGSSGDDTITLNGAAVTDLLSLDGGAGNDVLVLTGAVNLAGKALSGFETIRGSSGNETITLTAAQLAAFASLDGGGGSDGLRVTGDADLTGRTYTGFATLGGDGGTNVLTVDAAILRDHSLDGGAGTDTLVLKNAGAYDFTATAIKSVTGFESLTGSDGDDTITVGANRSGFASLNGGAGNDKLVLSGGAVTLNIVAGTIVGFETLSGTDGTDTLTLSGDLSRLTSIDGGGGTGDTLELSGTVNVAGVAIGGFATIRGSAGADTITIAASQLAAFATLTGFGGDTLLLRGDGDLTGRTYAGFATLGGDGAANTLTVDADILAAHSLNGGADTDTLALKNAGTYDFTVPAQVKSVTGFERLLGSDGADTIRIGANLSGFASIDGGAGNDRLVLTAATNRNFAEGTLRGFETLIGSSSNDSLALTATAMADLVSLDGGAGDDWLTLTGSSRVDLRGKIISNFETVRADANVTLIVDETALQQLPQLFGLGDSALSIAATNLDLTGRTFTGFAWVGGDGGANTVTVDAAFAAAHGLDGGAGNDRLALASGGTYDFAAKGLRGFETLTGSTGDDTITLNGAAVTDLLSLDGGAGNDRLVLSGTVNLAGKALSGFETIRGSSGNDTITLDAAQLAAFASLNGGGGTDTLLIKGDADLTGRTYASFATLGGDGGANTLTVDAALLAAHSLNGGADTDTLALKNAGAYDFTDATKVKSVTGFETLTGSEGDDTITFTGTSFSGFLRLDGSGGNDKLVLTAATNRNFADGALTGFETIVGSANADSLTLTGAAMADLVSLDGGAGDDRVVLSGTINLVGKTIVNVETLTGSGGNDEITVDAAVLRDLTLAGGAGNDTLRLATAGAYDFTDTAQVEGVSGFETLLGSAGNDTLTFNAATIAGFTALNGGDGSDTLVLTGNVDLSGKTITGFERIEIANGATVTFADKGTALAARAQGATASVTLTGATLTDAERTQLFAQGVRTVTDAGGTYAYSLAVTGVADRSVGMTALANPFQDVTVTATGASITARITLSNAAQGTLSNLSGGFYNAETGVYIVTGTAAEV